MGSYYVRVQVNPVKGMDPIALQKAVRQGLVSAAFRGTAVVRKATRMAPPASPNGGTGAVNTGAFLRAWRVAAGSRGPVLLNASPYASVIEHGRRPGKGVPIEPLTMWVLRKLGDKVRQQLREAGKKRTTANERLLAARGIAFAISRAIKKRGLRGRHVLAGSLPELFRIADHEVRVALYIAVRGSYRRRAK